MGFKLASAFVELGVRQRGLKSGLETAKGFLRSSLGAFSAITGTTIGLAGAAALASLTISAAANAEEMQSKFEAVFKELTGEAEQFATDFADSIGRGVGETKRQFSEFQDILVPLGFARKEALELSKQLVNASADLASFNNKSDPETAQALIRALTGERESLKSLGIVINEADVKQELLRKGQAKLTGQLMKQAKAQATLELIIRGSSDAQGDALRTSGSFTNKLKALKGAVADLAAVVGSVLLPELTIMVSSLNDAVRASRDWVVSFQDDVATFRFLAIAEFGKTFNNLMDWFSIVGSQWSLILQVMANDIKIFLDQASFGLLRVMAEMSALNFGDALKVADDFLKNPQAHAEALLAVNEKLKEAIRGQALNVKARLIEERRQRILDAAAARGGGGGAAAGEQGAAGKFKFPTGFIGVADLTKKIQEQTLKTVNPQKKMVGLMEADKVNQGMILQELKKVVENTDPATTPTVAVANG